MKSEALPITIRGVRKTYGDVCALAAMDLDIQAGEFLTLLGPSGSGKTTLLMILAGFIRPDCGSVHFGEREIILTPPHRRGVGMVFQNYALFPHMTVADNVAYPLKLRKVPAPEVQRRVQDTLELVQLGHLGERRIQALSGGQKQRVALARAIVFAPRILLMDEPLSALDKKLREQMQIELRQLHDRLGMTTVYVTHDQREALTMSDRIAVINEGTLMQLGTPQQIYDHPANLFIADFIGESALLPVRVQSGAAYLESLQDTPLPLPASAPPDGAYNLLLRPERLQLTEHTALDGHILFPGTAGASIYQGDSVLLHVRLAGGVGVQVRHPVNRQVAEGSAVQIGLPHEQIALIPRSDAPR